MNYNEDKKYSIVGKVEIGTDEYRDLIEAVKENEQKYSTANSERWKVEREKDQAKKELEVYKQERDKYHAFINSSEEIKAKYALYLAEQQLKERGES